MPQSHPLAKTVISAIDDAVEAYESAQATFGTVDLACFLPSREHPSYLPVLCELVRVDLEYGHKPGRPSRLGDYQKRFPELFEDRLSIEAIAFEEYRLRIQSGEPVSTSEYQECFGVDCLDWPLAPLPAVIANQPSRKLGDPHDSTSFDSLKPYRSHPRSYLQNHDEAFSTIERDDPAAFDRLHNGFAELDETSGRFLGFQLRSELGRGAFGRVFLAEQEEMANRRVVLKVTLDPVAEVNALAQLQHTNVVPIYSVHHSGSLHAICMPYLGSTTLADVVARIEAGGSLPDSGKGLLTTLGNRKNRQSPPSTIAESKIEATSVDSDDHKISADHETIATSPIERISRSNYVDAVLWMGVALADGLAHSHERGIIHRDLKPANILFADDGQPMLLDFNLAADQSQKRAAMAMIGGTLPYMALEHLETFQGKPRTVDAKSDLFSLGVILFQLFTGRLPYETRRGSMNDVLSRMIADRKGPVPRLRGPDQPNASPAIDAILQHLLEPDPERRYQSARHLQDDLQRQLDHRPLKHANEPFSSERIKKWAKRHPRLTSTTSLISISLIVIVFLFVGLRARQSRIDRLEAAESLVRLIAQVKEAEFLIGPKDVPASKIQEGINLCRHAIDHYKAANDPKWADKTLMTALSPEDRVRVRQSLGELFSLQGRGLMSATTLTAEQLTEAERLLSMAQSIYQWKPQPRILTIQQAEIARLQGDEPLAAKLRKEAELTPLRTPRERLLMVPTLLDAGRDREALELAEEATRLEPLDPSTWLLLGHCHAKLGQFESANHAFSIGIDLQPGFDWAYLDRGVVAMERRDYDQAVADFIKVLEANPDQIDARLNLGLARLAKGDPQGALNEWDRLIGRPEMPTRVFFMRARAFDAIGNQASAKAERVAGEVRKPNDELSYVSRGLSRIATDPQAAIHDFQEARRFNPRSLASFQNEASVLSENLGKTEEGVDLLSQALNIKPDSLAALTGRGVLLARLGRGDEARRDADAALALDQSADTLYRVACMFALNARQTPKDVENALHLIASAVRKDPNWLGQLASDPDLAPIRDRGDFRRLRDALEIVCPTSK